jgi:tRNA threonylcarbamoyladenosine biosynthesis protein TsaE
MTINSEKEMINLGVKIAKNIAPPIVIELLGDVGAGKTTLTKGIAKGLGVKEEIASPSFVVSKRYDFFTEPMPPRATALVHYDFYRLPDPGLMTEDLEESILDPRTVTIIEWAETVASVLPKNRIIVKITAQDNGSRKVKITGISL